MSQEIEQRSNAWFVKRLGFCGCSRLGEVLAEGRNGQPSSTRRNYMAELLCERLTGVRAEHFTTPEMRWGIEIEPFARSEYEARHGVMVQETGGKEHSTIPWWWGSPDFLHGNDGGGEIKCLLTANHLDVIFTNKIDTKYIYQISGYVEIFEREWYTYIGYDPRLPPNVSYFEKTFYRKDLPIDKVKSGVVQFLDELNDLVDKVKKIGMEPKEVMQEAQGGKRSLW